MANDEPKQKNIAKQAKQAKPGKIKKTAKATRPPKIRAAKPVLAKALAKMPKPAKAAKPAKAPKPGKSSKRARASEPAKLARQAKKIESKAKQAGLKAGKGKAKGKKAQNKAEISRKRETAKPARREKIEPRPSKSLTAEEKAARLPMVSPRMRIGLLGGSFNPAHAAHVEISLTALKRLGLDQVWWMVTPGNPLKHLSKRPSLSKCVDAARRVANHPRIAVTGFPGEKGSAYTIDLLTELKRRFPAVSFVWLMGADNLSTFHRWRSWQTIFASVPIAVLDRPGFRLKARASQAATRFQEFQIDESDAPGLARLTPPAWTIITHRLSSLSSTALRGEAKRKRPGTRRARKSASNTSY